jgi:hypothetical protein
MDERSLTMLNEEMMDLIAFDLSEQTRPEDDPWWSLTQGEISPQEAIARLSRPGGDDEDGLRQRVQHFTPPSVDDRQRTLDQLLAQCFLAAAAEPPAAGEAPARPLKAATPEPVHTHQAERPTPGRSRRRTWVALGSGALAMAAAAALVWVVQPPSEAVSPAILPGFDQEWGPGYVGAQRSEGPAVLPPGCDAQLHRDGDLTVTFRPRAEASDALAVAALAQQGDAPPRWLALDPERSTAGVITVDQSVAALGLTSGRWKVTFFIVRADDQPDPAVLVDADPGRHPGYTAIRNTVCVVG